MAIGADVISNENKWYRLDNAAKIYPAISGSNRDSVFRVAVQLKREVNPQVLQEALVLTLPRFPSFSVKMKKGLFWYYFEHNTDIPAVTLEKAPPCRKIITEETNGYLFRVSFYKRRISLEVFHALTDGTGAMAFLKSLVFQYLQLSACEVLPDDNILQCDMQPSLAETEDSFKRFYSPGVKSGRAEDKAYQITGTRMKREFVKIIHGIVSLKSFAGLVKDSRATITEYIAALIIYSIYSVQLKGRECSMPVKISVPVNLRKFFPSRTLRNFSSYVNVGFTFLNEDYTFEQVLENISSKIKAEIQPSRFIEKMSANVNAEKNIFLRMVPLFLKDVVLKKAFEIYGESLFTCSLSNLGVIRIPESMEEHIERFELVLGAPAINLMNCAVCTFGDNLVISFTKAMLETDIEKFFFRFLSERGVRIAIETN